MAALLPVESFAAVKMDLSNSRHYTGVMKELVVENRARRKAFNRDDHTVESSQTISGILHDRNRVDVNRPASDTEKNDILSMLIASVITYNIAPPVKTAEEVSAIESSPDPLAKHFYIVDMAGSFAHELKSKGRIESDFKAFQAFSGVDKDRFLKLFYQVKGNHRIGLKLQKATAEESEEEVHFNPNETVQDLIAITKNKVHPLHSKVLDELYIRAISSGHEKIRNEALQVIIKTAENQDHPLRYGAISRLIVIAKLDFDAQKALKNIDLFNQFNALQYVIQNEKKRFFGNLALKTLIESANGTNDYFKQWRAIDKLKEIAKNEKNRGIRKKVLRALIEVVHNDRHKHQYSALGALLEITKVASDKETCDESLNVLIEIARNYSHLYQETSLSYELPDIISNANDPEIKKKALDALINIAKQLDYRTREDALKGLLYVENNTKNAEIREAAKKARAGAETQELRIKQTPIIKAVTALENLYGKEDAGAAVAWGPVA